MHGVKRKLAEGAATTSRRKRRTKPAYICACSRNARNRQNCLLRRGMITKNGETKTLQEKQTIKRIVKLVKQSKKPAKVESVLDDLASERHRKSKPEKEENIQTSPKTKTLSLYRRYINSLSVVKQCSVTLAVLQIYEEAHDSVAPGPSSLVQDEKNDSQVRDLLSIALSCKAERGLYRRHSGLSGARSGTLLAGTILHPYMHHPSLSRRHQSDCTMTEMHLHGSGTTKFSILPNSTSSMMTSTPRARGRLTSMRSPKVIPYRRRIQALRRLSPCRKSVSRRSLLSFLRRPHSRTKISLLKLSTGSGAHRPIPWKSTTQISFLPFIVGCHTTTLPRRSMRN